MHVLPLDTWNPRSDRVAQAANALQDGNILLVPTDTTWALICDAQKRSAVSKLAALRSRNHRVRGDEQTLRKRPMALMCPSISSIGSFTVMDQSQFRLIKRILPGPYTVLLPVSRNVPRLLREKRKTIGIRLPDSIIIERILAQFDRPVFTTTARNDRGEILQDAVNLHHDLAAVADLVIETEPIIAQESTVLDATQNPPVVVRAGRGELEEYWIWDDPIA